MEKNFDSYVHVKQQNIPRAKIWTQYKHFPEELSKKLLVVLQRVIYVVSFSRKVKI